MITSASLCITASSRCQYFPFNGPLACLTPDAVIQFLSSCYLWCIFTSKAVITFQLVPLRADLVPEINAPVGDMRDVLSSRLQQQPLDLEKRSKDTCSTDCAEAEGMFCDLYYLHICLHFSLVEWKNWMFAMAIIKCTTKTSTDHHKTYSGISC